LSIELTEELSNAINETLPWGVKKYLFQSLIVGLLEAVKESGNDVLAAILRRQVRIKLEPIKED
jgi:hypothetical protein